MSNATNINFPIFDSNDFQSISEASTKIENIPDILLDERALEAQENLIWDFGLGSYLIQEDDVKEPSLLKENTDSVD